MTRLRHVLILVAIVLISLTGCPKNQVAFTVGPGETFTLGVGQSARITGEDMVVTFNEVIGDSRCAQNVVCTWEGVASISITVVYKGASYSMALNQPGLTEQAKQAFAGYTLTFSLNPYPRAGEEISPKDYRLTLTVTK